MPNEQWIYLFWFGCAMLGCSPGGILTISGYSEMFSFVPFDLCSFPVTSCLYVPGM